MAWGESSRGEETDSEPWDTPEPGRSIERENVLKAQGSEAGEKPRKGAFLEPKKNTPRNSGGPLAVSRRVDLRLAED